MELTAKEQSSVYWRGATQGALSGIVQGLLLGLGGALLLWGLAAAFPALGLVQVFQGFLFVGETAAAGINPIGFIALNTALTVVGNFLMGGNQAVAQAKQEKQNAYLDAKLGQIEGRERQMEQVISHHLNDAAHHTHAAPQPPRHVQQILEEGPRVRVDKPRESHEADIVSDRLEAAERTIH
jgi:hypothetical protein